MFANDANTDPGRSLPGFVCEREIGLRDIAEQGHLNKGQAPG